MKELVCPLCGDEMEVQKDRRGSPFLSCSNGCGYLFLSRKGKALVDSYWKEKKEGSEGVRMKDKVMVKREDLERLAKDVKELVEDVKEYRSLVDKAQKAEEEEKKTEKKKSWLSDLFGFEEYDMEKGF